MRWEFGFTIARVFANNGHDIAIVDLSETSVAKATDALTEFASLKIFGTVADVSDTNKSDAALRDIVLQIVIIERQPLLGPSVASQLQG